MALPRKLKNFNVFQNGESFIGQCAELALPKLTIDGEDYRGGGMLGPATLDLGLAKIEMDVTFGGYMRSVLNQFGIMQVDGVMLRFAGAYQRDDTGDVDAVEIITRGRYTEIDHGTAKAGENNDFKVKLACTYYKQIINGDDVIEIDLVNMVYIVNGNDRYSDQRRAIGI